MQCSIKHSNYSLHNDTRRDLAARVPQSGLKTGGGATMGAGRGTIADVAS
jgi:hypothetical protein